MGQDKVEAVERALTILGAFQADKPELTLADIAAATGFYKSTILRLAGSLERFGYLIREPNGAFRLGPSLWRLGSIYRHGFDLGDAIRPELRHLVDATQETASFYVREEDTRVCLFRQNSPQAARHHLDEGTQLPMSAGASAHVLAAYSSASGAKAASIKAQGYSVSLGERDPHVAAVAVPVFDIAARFRGALAISGLISRFNKTAQARALAQLKASAKRLATVLPASE